jgi:putative transcriptional regulator
MSLGHPGIETLEAHASGALQAGARMVVGVHLSGCAECRREVGRIEALGGVLLETAEPEALRPEAFAEVMAKLDGPSPARPARLTLGALMRKGVWIPFGTGLAIKSLNRYADAGEHLCMIRAKPGVALPDHGHNGIERLVVITGAVDDDTGRYSAGDLAEMGPEDRHQPIATGTETCLCLSATDAPLKMSGVARWIQPLIGL